MSKSLENKGVTSICLNEDENIITVNINEHPLNSDLSPEFDITISNIQNSLDSHIHSISIKEEIIYNISKFLRSIFEANNKPIKISRLKRNLSSINTEENFSSLISKEEWKSGLQERYGDLKRTVKDNFPELWETIEFILSCKSILNIQDCTLPFAGIILGAPSSSKTLGIEMVRDYPHSFYTDSFSPKSFVSHTTSVSKKELEKVDLLPKIKGKLFLTPELSPIFYKKDDELIETLGIFIRILGWKRL